MKGLIALDLDDTLLGKDCRIHTPGKEALAAARARGWEVTLVTARSWRATRELVEELQLTLPVICLTGAAFFAPDGKPLRYATVPLTDARRLAARADEEGWSIRLYYPEGVIFHSRPAEDYVAPTPAAQYPTERYVGNVLPYLEQHGAPLQIVTMGDRSVEGSLAEVAQMPDLIHTPYDRHTMASRTHIMHRSVTKGAALATLCQQLGVPRERVIAMGDSETDRSMIEWAGTGVAMGWAPEPVRQIANFVTAPDDEHPVASALTKLVLT